MLEGLLMDSLSYATWALTDDQYMSQRPWVYRPQSDQGAMMDRLSAAVSQRSGPEVLDFGKDSTLYPLARGFKVLAEMLTEARTNTASFERSKSDFPRFDTATELRSFPLRYSHPFLNLLANSQMAVLDGLKDMSRLLLSANVPEVRNGLAHFRRASADVHKLTGALEGVAAAVRKGEELGVVRIPYQLVSSTSNSWGQTTVLMRATNGQEVTFTRPSKNGGLGLPSFAYDQYLFSSAVFAEPNEMFRFLVREDSEYERMWDDYPRRTSEGSSLTEISLPDQRTSESLGQTSQGG
jgi:hypothetical protein